MGRLSHSTLTLGFYLTTRIVLSLSSLHALRLLELHTSSYIPSLTIYTRLAIRPHLHLTACRPYPLSTYAHSYIPSTSRMTQFAEHICCIHSSLVGLRCTFTTRFSVATTLPQDVAYAPAGFASWKTTPRACHCFSSPTHSLTLQSHPYRLLCSFSQYITIGPLFR